MKILADENIPLANEVFSSIGSVTTMPGREITNKDLKTFDALIVRSITQVNESLLHDTSIKFVGTATAGIDHIDVQYLKDNNIFFTNAHGSNATSVVEYIFFLIYKFAVEHKIHLQNKKLGVIGVGAVGGQLAHKAEKLGFSIFCNDPPRQEKGDEGTWKTLEDIYNCDIISLHTPLNKNGQYKTHHLFNENNLKKLKDNILFINASRGVVVDNKALLSFLKTHHKATISLDVWEGEPLINLDLLNVVYTGTPHIAGYSYDGKVRGTEMIFEQLCKYYNIKSNLDVEKLKLQIDNKIIEYDNRNSTLEESLFGIMQSVYNLEEDFQRFYKIKNQNNIAQYFDLLRKTYPIKREFFNFTVKLKKRDPTLEKRLQTLNFKIKET